MDRGRGRGLGRVMPAWMTEGGGGGGGGGNSPPLRRSKTISEIVADLDAIRDEEKSAVKADRLASFSRSYVDVDEFVYEDESERGGLDAMRRFFVNVYYHAPLHSVLIPKDRHVTYLVHLLRTSKLALLVLYEAIDGMLTRCYVFDEDRDYRVSDYKSFILLKKWPIILRYLQKKGVSTSTLVTYTNSKDSERCSLVPGSSSSNNVNNHSSSSNNNNVSNNNNTNSSRSARSRSRSRH